MQRAAAGLAAACADVLGRVYGSRVVLLVGSGDNGGDALYAGARLARRGPGCGPCCWRRGGRTRVGWPRCGGRGFRGGGRGRGGVRRAGRSCRGRDRGDRGKGGLREEAVPLAEAARRGRGWSSPSICRVGSTRTRGGTGAAVRADVTVTFGAYKPGLLIDPAREYAGVVRFVDIGLKTGGARTPEVEALQHADVARLLPVPAAESDKYRRGSSALPPGPPGIRGGRARGGRGLAGGAGAVRYVGPGGGAVLARHPETLVSERGPARAGRVQAWVVGPGAGTTRRPWGGAGGGRAGADRRGRVAVGGGRGGAGEGGSGVPTLMTPHAGEAAALLGSSGRKWSRGGWRPCGSWRGGTGPLCC